VTPTIRSVVIPVTDLDAGSRLCWDVRRAPATARRVAPAVPASLVAVALGIIAVNVFDLAQHGSVALGWTGTRRDALAARIDQIV
jgi:hypothetical protein